MKQTNRIWLIKVLLFGIMVICLSSCKKEENKEIPVLTTSEAMYIDISAASSGGFISSDGGSKVTARGVCWSILPNPTINASKTSDGEGSGSFNSSISGLNAGTGYYVRAYATNSVGTQYGNPIFFNTLQLPALSTSMVTDLTQTTAICGGKITSEGYSAIIAQGVCWSTDPTPSITDKKTSDKETNGKFISSLKALLPNTTYFIRAYATTLYGTGYGNIISFSTLNFGTVADNDGNKYKTIIIGNQTWMAENLKSTHYQNGDPIPNITDYVQWAKLTTGACCDYENIPANNIIYGKLYNYNALSDVRLLSPPGWHIPSYYDWSLLINYLGGESVTGGKLKETGFSHWEAPNEGATNLFQFTALPGGLRDIDGIYWEIGKLGLMWSSTEYNSEKAKVIVTNLTMNGAYIRDFKKISGFSVRCIKD